MQVLDVQTLLERHLQVPGSPGVAVLLSHGFQVDLELEGFPHVFHLRHHLLDVGLLLHRYLIIRRTHCSHFTFKVVNNDIAFIEAFQGGS